MDWQLLDDEAGALPQERPTPPPAPRRGRWAWLLLPLLAIAVTVAGVGWLQERREAHLRAELTEVVHEEARLWAGGMSVALDPVLDPAAPVAWSADYRTPFRYPTALTLLPEVGEVALDSEASRALVTILHPRPEGAHYEGLDPVPERRAYRLVEGAWRRTPLALDESERIEVRSETLTLRGPHATVEALNGDGRFLARMEALRRRLVDTWGEDRVLRTPLTIEVQPREFDGYVALNPFLVYSAPSHVTSPLVIPAPDQFVADPTLPLEADRQYELAVAQLVMTRLGGSRAAAGGDVPFPRLWTLWSFALELRTAEAAAWTLSEEELSALRAWRRSTLGGEWISPFEERLPADEAEEHRRAAALALLVDYLRLTYGDVALGNLAARLATGSDMETLADLVIETVTRQPIEALEAAARDFALREEP